MEAAERSKRPRGARAPARGSPPAVQSHGATVLHETVSYAPQPLSARHFDPDTGEPVSFYLSSLEELLAWKPTSDDDFNVATTPLADRQPPLRSKRPWTLVCHDMKNGYLGDRFIQGSAWRDPYVFYHWQYIDIFVYFSHHPVTIPPVGWTNAAHRHGVAMLGTFITEWVDGGELCEAFLGGEEAAYCAVAEQLGRLAGFYGFDGWLVNIENTLSEAAVRNLPLFLRALREQLQRAVPGGLVLWYDSVLPSGELQWQNELNEANRVFFDVCHGLFTNYNWKAEHLERMGAHAGERQADVYVGIDVFARGEVVGGGFETDKALRLIRQYGFSAAIFAPGWVYEHLGTKDFHQNQCRFWGSLAELLPTHSISTLPFSTSFCLGMGTRRFVAGQEEERGPWYNLSAQEIQPLFAEQRARDGAGGWLRTSCCLQDAWNGGSCLLIEGVIPPDAGQVAVRLFSFQTPAPRRLSLALRYKLEEQSPAVAVGLELSTWDAASCHGGSITALPGPVTRHRPQARLRAHRDTGGWMSRCYELELRDCTLHDLALVLSCPPPGGRFACRLGEIQVLDADNLPSPPPRAPTLTASQVLWQKGPGADQLSLSLTLRWSYPPGQARCFRIHCQGAARPRLQRLGLAHAPLYRVVGLAVPAAPPAGSGRLKFLVEPVPSQGGPVHRASWGRLVLVYSEPAGTSTN
ncbi:cytosolic endo-beta-N-acetylglucosaminidase isoform X2 [Pelodiscus sinensis]|uniref:cytosolic endo-beta-N-acetylglucosaminidase isoform X2 n=1 Tax=Pelodiscus sinensis TaxID=13735 RepID=UPI003F6B4A29